MANFLDLNTPFQTVDGQEPTPVTGDVPMPQARPAQPEFNVSPITPNSEEPFQVDDSEATTPPASSPETMDKRAFKIKYGLADIIGKGRDEIYADLAQGNEPDMRDRAAGEIDKRKSTALEDMIKQATANKGSPLTSDELSGMKSIVDNLGKTTDPQTVFETAYGKQFISELDKTAQRNPDDNLLTDATQKMPEQTAQILNEHSSLVAKREILTTKLENVEDEIKNQSWLGWGVDQAKLMVPLYHDVELRQNVPGVGVFTGLGLGANIDKQRIALMRMEPDDMKMALDKIVDPMKASNPTLAADFLRGLLGGGTNDQLFSNLTTPIDVAGLGLGKASVKAVKTILVKGTDKQLAHDVKTAAADMTRAAADPNASKSTIEAASGDLKQSAITRAVTDFVGDANGVPDATKRGLEAMSSVHRTDLQAVKANPGRFGQDIVNRITEMYDSVGPIMQKAEEIGKVERLPEVMSNEVAVRSIIDNMKDNMTYRGLRNSIIDTSKPYKEGLSNNWLVDFYMGHADGTYFTNRNVADNFIKFHGLNEAQVAEGSNPALTKTSRAVQQIENNLKTARDTIDKINTRLSADKYTVPEKKVKDQETLDFLQNEAIPGYETKLQGAKAQKATVEQQGLGYYVKITKPINETDDVVRDVIARTKNTQIPNSNLNSFVNSWIGKFRTPEDTLSRANRANRLVATYNPSELVSILKSNSPNIQRIASSAPRFSKGRQKFEEFKRLIEQGQELWDVQSKSKGYFYQSPEELETAYQSYFKRLPDADEIAAYFEFKRNMEIDRAFRNIVAHRDQTRLGVETHKIISTDPDGKSFPTPEFSAVNRRTIGGSTDNVAIIGDKYGFEKIKNLAAMSLKDKKEWQELIDNGTYKYLELYNPELRPLKGYGRIDDSRIRYVLAKTVETKPLDWEQIPRRGGGHVEYDYNYYIKQAKVVEDASSGHNWYEGDTTVMPVQVYKMGADFAKKLNTVRKLLQSKQEDAAKDYSNKNLHIDWSTIQGWFKGQRQPDGSYVGARLSLKEPIQVVRRGEAIVDKDDSLERRYSSFRNGNKEGSLARQNRLEFSQERDSHDVFTLENQGTADNPLYSIAPADKVDPITVLNRGLSSIAQSNFMDDYKIMSVEHWLQQAGKYLSASESEIRHSPFYYFKEAKFLPNVDPQVKAQLETAKAHIQQLIGQPSDTAKKLQNIAQKLADSSYTKLGPDTALVNEWDLHKLTDPFRFIRSITYTVKMGLFNVPQFIVQAGNYSNILGIAGYRYAAPGTLGAQLHFWSRVNSSPEIIDYLDKMASRFNLPGTSHWKPGEFKEAFQEFKKTGFGNVGGESAALDDPMNQGIVTTATDRFLDAGKIFVNGGERNSRYGSWYTAFKEFRDGKPFGKITDQDRLDILQRADLLNINMSRASSSALHSGIMSIPTQFLTYQIRLFELFMSNRITAQERMRMFLTNSLLYGLPMGVGLTGVPAADYIRQKMMEHSYVVGDDFFKSTAMEGLLSSLAAVATGKGDPSAGTWFDFGSRFGSKGLEFLGGINRGDKSFLDVAGGPAYSILKGTLEQSDGFWRVMTNLVRPDSELFPVTPEDFIDPLKEISSVNSAFRTLAAINTGRYVSKREGWLADATPFQAVFAGLTSLKDQRIDDIQTFKSMSASQKDFEKTIEQQFLQEYRRAVVAEKDENHDLAKTFFTRARAWLIIGGYPEDKISALASRAASENKSTLDRVTFDFYRKQTNKQQGLDSLTRTQQVKNKQQGVQD